MTIQSEEKLLGLDLFSGIGGITLALSDWVIPIAYCEIDRYAQGVLLSRMSEGQLPIAPIWDDITTLKGSLLPYRPQIIYGGFPCQDLSVAGNKKGLVGKRSGLFFELCRLVKEVYPSLIFLENVPGIRVNGLREVIRELTDLGYDCRWTCVSAQEVGAKHLRQRWFLVGNSNNQRCRKTSPLLGDDKILSKTKEQSETSWYIERANTPRMSSTSETLQSRKTWISEPSVGRMVDGVQFRVDRIKSLGNSVVPIQAKEAFQRLIGLKQY